MRNLAGNLLVYLHILGLMVAAHGAVESLAGFFGDILVLIILGACVAFCVCRPDWAKSINMSEQFRVTVLVTLLAALLLCTAFGRLVIVRVDECDIAGAVAYFAWLFCAAPLLVRACRAIFKETGGPSVALFCMVAAAFWCTAVLYSGFAIVCRVIFPTTACIAWLASRHGLRVGLDGTIQEGGKEAVVPAGAMGARGASFSLVSRCIVLNLCACILFCGMVGHVALSAGAVGLTVVFGTLAFLLLAIPGCLYFDARVHRGDGSSRLWAALYFMLLAGLLPLVAAVPDSLSSTWALPFT